MIRKLILRLMGTWSLSQQFGASRTLSFDRLLHRNLRKWQRVLFQKTGFRPVVGLKLATVASTPMCLACDLGLAPLELAHHGVDLQASIVLATNVTQYKVRLSVLKIDWLSNIRSSAADKCINAFFSSMLEESNRSIERNAKTVK